ncbi:uncharacterized protein [Magallana gigas]|uniref:uncharacterized protein isoform X5 n=1 Tax=Magallana gigas TaxID=29159 RepID=UPI00333FEBFE
MNMVLGQSFLIFVSSVFIEATHLNSNHTMHWSEAVQFCSKSGLVLKKSKLGLTDIDQFWTRLYRKESDFIYLHGCMNTHNVYKSEHMKIDQCIQECLNKRHHFFVMQNSSCFCLSDLQPKLQQQCNLTTSSFVFGAIETSKNRESCLIIDCHENKSVHLVNCDEGANVFCGDKVSGNFTWKSAAEQCMKTKASLKHDHPNQICSEDDTNNKMRYWFGFGTLEYTEEFLKSNDESDVNQTLCQSCNDVCKFKDCNMTRIAACESNVESVSVTITIDRESGTTKDRPHQPTKDMLFQTTNLVHDQTTKYTKIKLDKTTKEKLTHTERDAAKDGQVKTTKEMPKQITMELTKDGENKTIEQSTKVASDTTTDVKEPYQMVAVYCLSILVLILSLLVVYCLCQRCRNQKKQILENKSGISNNPPAENLALTTVIYELADNSKLDRGDQNHTEENTVKEPGNIIGSIGGLTKLTGRQTNEDVYNHLWEKAADSCPKKENMYDQCNLGGEDIYKYGVTSGPHASSATVNTNYDRVTLVSANVNTSR